MAGDLCEKGRPMGRGDGVGAVVIVFFGVEAAGAFDAVAILSLLSHAPGRWQRSTIHKGLFGEHLSAARPSWDFSSTFALHDAISHRGVAQGGNISEIVLRNGLALT